jgi:RNase P/RNase MRP subunit POP5
MDYYAEARRVAAILETEGMVADANSLIEALEAGATATEILMALRWNLRRIQASLTHMSAPAEKRVCELSQAIDKALGG